MASLAGCGITIHPGGNDLAFLRSSAIWVIQPDGTNRRLLTSGSIVSLAWSPDHHQVLYRVLEGGGQLFPTPTGTRAVPDAVSDIALISINGGYPLVLTRADDTLARGDPWWNQDGNRLVYRQEFAASSGVPTYIVSQSDQPAGIAIKPLLNAASLPVLSADGHQVAVVDSAGDLRLGAPSDPGTILEHGALLTLPNTGRPAHLLWQPAHDALLYPASNGIGGVKLVLVGTTDGKPRWSLSVPALLDAAFSPDGSLLLLRTPNQFEVFAVGSAGTSHPLLSWPESDASALPWWAPDSNRLVILDQAGLTLVDVHQHKVQLLGGEGVGLATSTPSGTATQSQWHPATTDPWSSDGSQLVFAAGKGDRWQGTALPAPHASNRGLYVVLLTGDVSGRPTLIDSGNDSLPVWSYPDPSTAFLIGA